MNYELENVEEKIKDETNNTEVYCEECCCFEIDACEVLHSKGCKVVTTCCW